MHTANPPAGPLPAAVLDYVQAAAHAADPAGLPLVSIIVFGSATTGGHAGAASDVDLILVLEDGADRDARARLRTIVEALELEHGLRAADDRPAGALDLFARKLTGNFRSFFVATRGDVLSGDPARLLDIPPAQAAFVDRTVIPSIVGSAVTAWGEDLLPVVPLRPIRRVDVWKAFFGFCNQVLLSAALYPLLPTATKYALGALKRSVHNCYFCYHLRPAPLDDEVAFFRQRLGPVRAVEDMLSLRRSYRRSFGFVLATLPALVRLHRRTARDNRFPRVPLPRARGAGPAGTGEG